MDAVQPPVPPQVAGQQAPLAQFAQQAAGAQGSSQPGADGGQDTAALSASLVDGIGKQMTQLAQILTQTKPELVPILRQGVQAMVMISSKLKTQQGQQAQGAPTGGDAGTAPSGEAQSSGSGGAAMGMPQ